jgi:methyltransferase (TIGR00027 family)
MTIERPKIQDVTDTAIWVAAYRAEENKRKDALFRDPFAEKLIGEKGIELARRTQGSRYTAWSVVIRTYIIDHFIEDLISSGKVNTVLNLGAGLDSRAYRMNFPPRFRWIEVDFPKMIDYKKELLQSDHPKCQLEYYSFDLSLEDQRDILLEKLSFNNTDKVLVLTEGVIPYLNNENASQFVHWLYQQNAFLFWITEYYSPEILSFLRTPKRLKQMEQSPFLFNPDDWFGFFKERGWTPLEIKYFGEVSEKVGRTPPVPSWLRENDLDGQDRIKKFLGYSLLKKL